MNYRDLLQRTSSYPRSETAVPDGSVTCTSCGGDGECVSGFHGYSPIQDRCPTCNGFGYVPAANPACEMCQDTGEVATPDSFGEYDGTEPCWCCDRGRAILDSIPSTPFVAGSVF